MKIKKYLTRWLMAMCALLSINGCIHNRSFQPENEMSFSLEDISEITISYDKEKITFLESEDDNLTIKEYMTENKDSYYAKIEKSKNSIKVSEGGKPLLKRGFTRYIEVYLPPTYHENMTVTTTDGNIDISEIELSLNNLRIDSIAGSILLNDVEAKNICLSSSKGIFDKGKLKADSIKIETKRKY